MLNDLDRLGGFLIVKVSSTEDKAHLSLSLLVRAASVSDISIKWLDSTRLEESSECNVPLRGDSPSLIVEQRATPALDRLGLHGFVYATASLTVPTRLIRRGRYVGFNFGRSCTGTRGLPWEKHGETLYLETSGPALLQGKPFLLLSRTESRMRAISLHQTQRALQGVDDLSADTLHVVYQLLMSGTAYSIILGTGDDDAE